MYSARRWICLILVLIAAGLSAAAAEENSPGALKIACLVRANSQYWDRFIEGVEAESAAAGTTVLVLYTSGQEHVIGLADAVNVARFSGCSVIICSYSDNEAYLAGLLQARAEGRIVIFVDNDGAGEYRDCYVGVDTFEAGRELASLMLRHLRPGESALLCMSPYFSGNQNQQLLKSGIEAVFAASGYPLEYFSDTVNVDQTRQTELDAYLNAHPEVHGVFSLSQLQTRGYLQLAGGASWGGRVHFVGIDYQPSVRAAIEDGTLSLLDKNSYGLGVAAVQTAVRLAAGETIEGRCVYIDTLVLDAESIADYADGPR